MPSDCLRIKKIRISWDSENEKWYFSIVDVIAILTESNFQKARNYWKVLKHRLKAEGNETVTNCNQLRLVAPDGSEAPYFYSLLC